MDSVKMYRCTDVLETRIKYVALCMVALVCTGPVQVDSVVRTVMSHVPQIVSPMPAVTTMAPV